jgi:hypothetical protein
VGGRSGIWGAIATIRSLNDDRDERMASRYKWFDPNVHGRGNERAHAFALGFIADPAACRELSQFQRLERVQLGSGLELELMQGARAQAHVRTRSRTGGRGGLGAGPWRIARDPGGTRRAGQGPIADARRAVWGRR